MPTDVVSFPEMAAAEDAQIRARRIQTLPEHLRDHGHFGIGLSGGGIRSATLNLGILQGLAERGMLPYLDYLSTVSGGGYIGTWLHSVILRYGKGQPANVEQLLSPKQHPIPGEADQDPITFLRKYSSYLAPEMGLFSADFWVIFVIWFRNMLLNQLILVSFLACTCLAAVHIGFLGNALIQSQGYVWLLLLAALCTLWVISVASKGVRGIISRTTCNDDPYCADRPRGPGNRGVGHAAVVTIIAAFLIACAHSWFAQLWQERIGLIAFAIVVSLLFAFLQIAGGFLTCYQERKPGSRLGLPIVVLCSGVAGIASSVMLVGCAIWMDTWASSNASNWNAVAWGPPLIMLVWLAGAGLHIGMMGGDFPDFAREWLARTGAYIFIGAFSWAALFALGVFGPQWMSAFALDNGKKAVGLIGTWIATTAGGVLAGKSGKTSGEAGDPKNSAALEWFVKIAPAVFLIGILLLVSFGVHIAIGARNHPCEIIPASANAAPPQSVTIAVADSAAGHTSLKLETDGKSPIPGWLMWLEPINRTWWSVYACADRVWVAELVGIAAGIVLLLCWRVNINEFSMHHFYKNRLVRCYLGASRGKSRSPSRLTGFDSCDDLPLTMFRAEPDKTRKECQNTKHNYYGPYPIINGTVNLDRGSELAKQERKGESFVFTPLFSGFDPPRSPNDDAAVGKNLAENGYRDTCGYMQCEGPGIGTCMAISGAAANPNWGYHTSSPVAFLLTMFDVRLGWWVGNPRRDYPSRQPGPGFALRPLLSELFAQTDARAAYLNISDGGHFENLGLYELIHRRCRYIIIGDGEEDADLTFGSLGGAVRKCRADFGVEIDIDPRRIRRKDGLSSVHCVVGTVHYPQTDQHPKDHGWILYLKSSLTGDEPEDVTQYQAVHPVFPHESTADQFFTESQFESYRRLGQHIVESAFGNVKLPANALKGILNDPDGLERLFNCLYQQWYPPTEIADAVTTHHTEAYSALLKRLEDPNLAHLIPQIFCNQKVDCGAEPKPLAPPPDPQKEFFFCLEAIQLIENVWADVHLFNRSDLENPRNAGWISVFRYWARQPAFQSAWQQASYTYNPLFRQFFEAMAASPSPQKVAPPCGDLPFKT